jgi:hypothetical protein
LVGLFYPRKPQADHFERGIPAAEFGCDGFVYKFGKRVTTLRLRGQLVIDWKIGRWIVKRDAQQGLTARKNNVLYARDPCRLENIVADGGIGVKYVRARSDFRAYYRSKMDDAINPGFDIGDRIKDLAIVPHIDAGERARHLMSDDGTSSIPMTSCPSSRRRSIAARPIRPLLAVTRSFMAFPLYGPLNGTNESAGYGTQTRWVPPGS